MNKEFTIKSSENCRQSLRILTEKKDGYDILITKYRDNWKVEQKEFISKSLFIQAVQAS